MRYSVAAATATAVGVSFLVYAASKFLPDGAPKPFNWGGWVLVVFLYLGMIGVWHVIFSVSQFRREAKQFLDAAHEILTLSREDRDVIGQIREIVKGKVEDLKHETVKLVHAADVVTKAVSDPPSGKIPAPRPNP